MYLFLISSEFLSWRNVEFYLLNSLHLIMLYDFPVLWWVTYQMSKQLFFLAWAKLGYDVLSILYIIGFDLVKYIKNYCTYWHEGSWFIVFCFIFLVMSLYGFSIGLMKWVGKCFAFFYSSEKFELKSYYFFFKCLIH